MELKYNENYNKDKEFKLLELNEDLLDCLNNNGSFEFKGDVNEDAVLCTNDKTFNLRSRNHSNSLTLIDQSSDDTGVLSKVFNEILEIQRCPPKLDKIDDVLSHRTLLDIHERPMEINDNGQYTYEDLSSIIQASDEEIKTALINKRIVNFNGELRPVDSECLLTILDIIQNTIELNEHSFDNFDKEKLVNEIVKEHEIDDRIIDNIVSWYTIDRKFNTITFVKEIGICVLKSIKQETVNTFMDKWNSNICYSLKSNVDLKLLRGRYLIDDNNLIKYFTSSSLSKIPSVRFQEVFRLRSKWFSDDLIPFLEDLGDSKELEKMIMKFCRTQFDKISQRETYTSRQRI